MEGMQSKLWKPLADPWHYWGPKLSALLCLEVGCGGPISVSRMYLPHRQPVWELQSSCEGAESSFCTHWEADGSNTLLTVSCAGDF